MHKQKKVSNASWEAVEATVRRWENSGLSQAAFCRRERIPEWKLSEWKRRVSKESAKNVQAERPVKFAPVTVVDGANDKTSVNTSRPPATEKLPALDVIVIRLPEGSSISALQQIVQAVSAKC